jgi:Ca-activated chloride channel homolog
MIMRTIQFLLTFMLVFSMAANAQSVVVTGQITDETNSPIIGASVTIKGTRQGTVTNANGNYLISVTKGKTLVFSFVGYENQEVVVNSTQLNVKLKPALTTLNECVVIGYGSQKRMTMTGAVSSVNGRVAGCMVSAPSPHSNYRNRPTINYVVVEDYLNTEEYSSFKENRFVATSAEALSTFSLDVDAASYSNMRRMINQGQKPERDMIRIEEMVNYFSYNYPQPTGEHPVNILTEATVCPWNAKHKLVRIGVKAREIPSENLPASNFVFLIDVSGSMQSANKLELVKSSLKLLTNNLRAADRVSIVVYAGAAGEVLPSTSGADRQKIKEAIDNLYAGGSTAGGAGIQLAYKIAEKNFMDKGNNRIILCTDGDFNVGISMPDELENLIESKRKTGIYLTVLGYGMGNYKDNKLQTLAQKGNGNHAYIDNLQEANKVLVGEFGSTMYTVAKDVKIQVEFNPQHVNAYRLIGYESRMLNKEDFNDDTKDAGELGSGHTVTAMYEVIPVGVENTFGGVDDLKYQPAKKQKLSQIETLSDEMLTVKLRYKKPDENESRKLEVPVLLKSVSKEASADLKFAMAVAMFGQLIRESDFKGDGTYQKALELAREGLYTDANGYRREFVRLAETVKQMEK